MLHSQQKWIKLKMEVKTMNENELEMNGFVKVYDYSQYAHDNNVNVIPEEDFKRLVRDTFKTITDTLKATYGPYGSSVLISEQSETTSTKDGYNVFQAIGFNHSYKRMVYLTIKKIIDRVNRNVGDGTTSCILLAEKIFNNLNEVIKTPDDKRRILNILSQIECNLQDTTKIKKDIDDGVIKKLTPESLTNLILLASNYDDDLTVAIYDALDPNFDIKTGDVSVRNVVPDSDVSLDIDSDVVYSHDFLPGDYRVTINMGIDAKMKLNTPTKIKCVLYDHAFNQTDWKNFIRDWDNTTPTLILARTFTRGFMDYEWMDYLKEVKFTQKMKNGDGDPKILLGEIKGAFVQHEIQDLGFIIQTEPRGMHASVVDHSTLPEVTVEVYKGNCLAFYDINIPAEKIEDYVNKLETEMKDDTSHSYVKEKEYRSRINCVKMITRDTLLTVKCSSTLESKLLMDKIDDCISIVNSAINSGIVPNLLHYASNRTSRMLIYEENSDNVLENQVLVGICKSIDGLFNDIYMSRYGKECDVDTFARFYDYTSDESYNIIIDDFVPMETLPTSAQYDLEVLSASISIVKYLLTSRALIFDAHLMTCVNDVGHYAQQ